MSNRRPNGPSTSESFFDESSGDKLPFAEFITRWNQTVPPNPGEDPVSCFQGLEDINSAEVALQKDDSASVSSFVTMGDSTYGSLAGASRRGTTAPEQYQAGSPQETRSQVGEPYYYSPGLSADTYTSLPSVHTDVNQMFLPGSSAEAEIGEGNFSYTNYGSTQGYGSFSQPNISRFGSAENDIAQSWNPPEVQTYAPSYNLNQARQSHPFIYPNQEGSEFRFNQMLQPQGAARRPQLDAVSMASLENMRGSSTMTAEHTPTNETAFASFIVSPAASLLMQPTVMGAEFADPQRFIESSVENTDAVSVTLKNEELSEDAVSPRQSSRAQQEESQGRVARTDPLYQAKPGSDDLYHCPHEGEPGCNHKPTKLKCNYDKYVDSHLRPFRCKDKTCMGVQFSSTACLLRHEREAHGLHGHGSKPHLCRFPDCERSEPGHGFPRRYNLNDHMKRVHNYVPQDDGSASPTDASLNHPQQDAKRQPRKRKRKSAVEEAAAEKRQKQARETAKAEADKKARMQLRVKLQADFNKLRVDIVRKLTEIEDPKELKHLQLNEEVLALQKLSTQLEGLG